MSNWDWALPTGISTANSRPPRHSSFSWRGSAAGTAGIADLLKLKGQRFGGTSLRLETGASLGALAAAHRAPNLHAVPHANNEDIPIFIDGVNNDLRLDSIG